MPVNVSLRRIQLKLSLVYKSALNLGKFMLVICIFFHIVYENQTVSKV